jgi:hypothetical protein
MAENELDTLKITQAPAIPARPAFDSAKYLPHVEDLDLSESQKIEFLETLYYIMAAFVRVGFDVNSVVPAFQKALEQVDSDEVELTIPTHEFNGASADEAKKAD